MSERVYGTTQAVVEVGPSDMTRALPEWFSWPSDNAPAEVIAASMSWLEDENNWIYRAPRGQNVAGVNIVSRETIVK